MPNLVILDGVVDWNLIFTSSDSLLTYACARDLKFSPDPNQIKTRPKPEKNLVRLELVQVLYGLTLNLTLTYTCARNFKFSPDPDQTKTRPKPEKNWFDLNLYRYFMVQLLTLT